MCHYIEREVSEIAKTPSYFRKTINLVCFVTFVFVRALTTQVSFLLTNRFGGTGTFYVIIKIFIRVELIYGNYFFVNYFFHV